MRVQYNVRSLTILPLRMVHFAVCCTVVPKFESQKDTKCDIGSGVFLTLTCMRLSSDFVMASEIKSQYQCEFVRSLLNINNPVPEEPMPWTQCYGLFKFKSSEFVSYNFASEMRYVRTRCPSSNISIRLKTPSIDQLIALQWRHNGRDSVSNHQPHHCLLNDYSDADQRKHQSSASLAFVWGSHRGPVNFPHKWPVMRKMFPFDDVIMAWHGDADG